MLHRTIPLASSYLQQEARDRLIEQSQQHENIFTPIGRFHTQQYEQEDSIDPFGNDRRNITLILNRKNKLNSQPHMSNLLNATKGLWNKKYRSKRNSSLQDYRILQERTERQLEKANDNRKDKAEPDRDIQRQYSEVANINIRELQIFTHNNLTQQARRQFLNNHLMIRSIKYRQDHKEIKNTSPIQKIANKLKLKKLVDVTERSMKQKKSPQPMLNTTLSGTNIYHSLRSHKKQEANMKNNSFRSHSCPLQNVQLSRTIQNRPHININIQGEGKDQNEDNQQKRSQTIVLHTLKDRYLSPMRNMQIRLQRNEYKLKALRNHAQFNIANQIKSQMLLSQLASPIISPIFVGEVTE